MPPPNGKSEHVIGNCISLLAITIVMLADYAAMNITSKHMIGNCILRLAISIHMLSISTTPACFVRHFASMICAGLRNNYKYWFLCNVATHALPYGLPKRCREAEIAKASKPRPHQNAKAKTSKPSDTWSSRADATLRNLVVNGRRGTRAVCQTGGMFISGRRPAWVRFKACFSI